MRPLRQYELGTTWKEGSFPLDRRQCEICTRDDMIRHSSVRGSQKRPGVVVRTYRRVHGSWRKIATGAAALLAVAMAFHVIFGRNGLTVYQQKRQETLALSDQLRSLQRENGLLQGHVERLKDDPSAIEHQAREELHYARPDEVIYTLPAPPVSPDNASGASSGGR